MVKSVFFNRDLSWLSFNERVLLEAAKTTVPILERIKFLSIYSSNLDEFYRVRMPVLMALNDHEAGVDVERSRLLSNYDLAKIEINKQQQKFGEIILTQILPQLAGQGIHWIYNTPIPEIIYDQVSNLFFTEVLAYINAIYIDNDLSAFFAENNKLYQAVILSDADGIERIELINIPSDNLPRFYSIYAGGDHYIVFLEDIIKHHMAYLFPDDTIKGIFNLKITREAELKIDKDEDDITAALEKQLETRDFGFATRFLCEPGIPLRNLYRIIYALNLQNASIVEGGTYHNLKDLSSFPLPGAEFSYTKWPPLSSVNILPNETLFNIVLKQDLLLNVPYQSYDPVLRFFNEAANDRYVTEIYTTLYRVASNSKIVSALSTAAKNGKKVVVMVELKARFDEANNIKWAKQMKAAGVKIIYSSIDLKVHAKVALVKRLVNEKDEYLGLFATGNLNEITARFYTDQILLTAHQPMLKELESLFGFLSKHKKSPAPEDHIDFKHLLVAQFNLQDRFIGLIDREISNAVKGLPAGITIKLNNLEEQVLISKLYEASQAGVKIQLIVRGICCLIPGVTGLSEHITVTRIVDRYLEHGRIFIFENNEDTEIFLGSADWMNRNIYSRIEVCFPVYDQNLKNMILKLIKLQLKDDVQQSIYLFLQTINEAHP
ncbi:polyphosphate kinase 1 [Pedobacter metabolipauper]|uniref:Polyphosphate kinase n=1 Tax=Pedobacter metabolipauper TaxID=425513 RepID=A0A4R6SXT3_9SPHI|nr:polyphosphate kinase 1 [Pedobacter metabolipauper]TDQ11324.1 polyphosphate kinase [Pedobacter metabolipauper]